MDINFRSFLNSNHSISFRKSRSAGRSRRIVRGPSIPQEMRQPRKTGGVFLCNTGTLASTRLRSFIVVDLYQNHGEWQAFSASNPLLSGPIHAGGGASEPAKAGT